MLHKSFCLCRRLKGSTVLVSCSFKLIKFIWTLNFQLFIAHWPCKNLWPHLFKLHFLCTRSCQWLLIPCIMNFSQGFFVWDVITSLFSSSLFFFLLSWVGQGGSFMHIMFQLEFCDSFRKDLGNPLTQPAS